MKNNFLLAVAFFFSAWATQAQWTNRYPKVEGYGHHVYLEGYDFPVLNAGPLDPAPSPVNNMLLFSAKGWLWMLDTNSLEAERITSSAGMDSKPNWAPSGEKIVFVRDNSINTQIVLLDLRSKQEIVLVDTDAVELDPVFAPSGESVYYASSKNGSFDLWQINLNSSESTPVFISKGLQRSPIPTAGEDKIVYLNKEGFSYDGILLYDIANKISTPLVQENFMSQTSFSLSPDNETLAYTWPSGDDYELRMLNINKPESRVLLSKGKGLPLMPKFDHEGEWIYYSEYNKNEVSELKRIQISGGTPEVLTIKNWNWGTPTGKIRIISKVDGQTEAVRLNIVDAAGHPVIPNEGLIHSEGQNGMVFFYSPGKIEIEAPVGELTITATHGFETIKVIQKASVQEGLNETTLNLKRIWNANKEGWYAADNHFHLNYGGSNQLNPEDILLDLKAEGIDIGYPLVANLGNRFLEQELLDYKSEGTPILRFGQEVRSHFFGHLNIIGTNELYWPWVWGPGYDIYRYDDRLNAEPLRFAREKGALAGYVHPVAVRDPFEEANYRTVPKALVADVVLGEVDILEIGCLWTDEIGTAALWHQVLNLGIPLAMSAGSDVMNDLYRTMAIGAARVYVKPQGTLTESSYLEALKNGRSFVSNGPMLHFTVEGKGAGDVLSSEKNKASWALDIYSPVPFEKVEIFVNGKVVWTRNSKGKNIENYKGSFEIPEGGWVTARVSEGKSEWPMMDSYPYAESSPIWFNAIGSTSAAAKSEAAKKLLAVLRASNEIVKDAYADNEIPNITAHFAKAEKFLVDASKMEQ